MYHCHCLHILRGKHISLYELVLKEQPHSVLVVDMVPGLYMDLYIYDRYRLIVMNNLCPMYILAVVQLCNQCTDYQLNLVDIYKQPYDFGVYIQPWTHNDYRIHMDLHIVYFRKFYPLDNHCYCGIQQYYICPMDFHDNRCDIYTLLYYCSHSIQHFHRMDHEQYMDLCNYHLHMLYPNHIRNQCDNQLDGKMFVDYLHGQIDRNKWHDDVVPYMWRVYHNCMDFDIVYLYMIHCLDIHCPVGSQAVALLKQFVDIHHFDRVPIIQDIHKSLYALVSC